LKVGPVLALFVNPTERSFVISEAVNST